MTLTVFQSLHCAVVASEDVENSNHLYKTLFICTQVLSYDVETIV